MTGLERVFSYALSTINDVEVLKQFVLFCAAVLFVGLLLLTYDIDLSPGLV
jgi:hypothetical protein